MSGNASHHTYEVTKIELLNSTDGEGVPSTSYTSNSKELPNGQMPRPLSVSTRNSGTSNGVGTPKKNLQAYPLAKLLKDVEKSYDKGKKLLDESGVTPQSDADIYNIEPNSDTESVDFREREGAAPQKTGIGYKVFYLKDGKLYPPMVANPEGAGTQTGVWLDAEAAPIAGYSKTGRPQVKAGGKGTHYNTLKSSH